ncbi:hypothetical protein VM1G_05129 [Cytospora mali]|uniref:Uncharacterized protein n=1 Tax=Cytospora mali TaxID=578113 RepID=A0A194W1T2_CYTMA|nr:hypothetical protein VM1G_05129 [Valsa mali]
MSSYNGDSSDTDSADIVSIDSPGSPPISLPFSPMRPGESDSAFAQRFRAHRDAERRQYIDEYYRERAARLPSPEAYPRQHQDRAEMVRHVEEDIYWESRPVEEYWNSIYEYPVDRAHRLGLRYGEPGLSLTDVEDNEDNEDDLWEAQSMRPEDREWLDALGILGERGSPSPEAPQEAAMSGHKGGDGLEDYWAAGKMAQTGAHKRKREPEEGGGIQGPIKRARAGEAAATSEAATTSPRKRKRVQEDNNKAQGPAKRARAGMHATTIGTAAETSEAQATSGHKRKRVQPEEDSRPQARTTRSQSGAKKRRTDTTPTIIATEKQLPATAEPGSKRKRVLDDLQTSQERPKRRRGADKDARPLQTPTSASLGSSPATTSNVAGERKRKSSASVAKKSLGLTQASRVTRAQRRQLSGKDAQLFQLGQRGELDVQGSSGLGTSKDAAGKRRSARSGTGTSIRPTLKEDAGRSKRAGQGKVRQGRA